MTGLPRLINPMSMLFDRAGAQIALVTVELWSTGIVIRLAAVVDDPELAYAFDHRAFTDWVAGGHEGRPPDTISERLLDLEIGLTDDKQHTYRLTSRSLGGAGKELRGEWHFEPAVQADAARLDVAVNDDENAVSVSVKL